jgi:hypothetical protein
MSIALTSQMFGVLRPMLRTTAFQMQTRLVAFYSRPNALTGTSYLRGLCLTPGH